MNVIVLYVVTFMKLRDIRKIIRYAIFSDNQIAAQGLLDCSGDDYTPLVPAVCGVSAGIASTTVTHYRH